MSKNQAHIATQPGGTAIPQKKTSYDWAYTYGAAQPHAASLIGNRAFSYDANGNQTGWQSTANGTRRTITWDEENRIQQVADNGHVFIRGPAAYGSDPAFADLPMIHWIIGFGLRPNRSLTLQI